MIAGKLLWASAKSAEISLGKVTVVMAERGHNRLLIVASLLLGVS